MSRSWSKATPYLLILPSLLLLVVFTYYPILYSAYLSLFRYDVFTPQPVFDGLANYARLVRDPIFWLVAKNTLIYVSVTIPITMLLGLGLAILVNEPLGRFRALYRTAFFHPTMIPMAAAGMLWVWLLNPSVGLVNHYLSRIGLPRVEWLYDMGWALPAIMLTSVWKHFGYYMLIYLAGLQMIPGELYEAASIEGARWWHRLRYITIPLVAPTTIFVVVVGIISSFQVFDLVHVMTQGGPADRTNVMVYYIYQHAFRFWDIGQASALTVVFVAGLLAVILALLRALERRAFYEV
ncbi:MAG TPA: sugar ABC transporter permease [Limnochordales bacterium]